MKNRTIVFATLTMLSVFFSTSSSAETNSKIQRDKATHVTQQKTIKHDAKKLTSSNAKTKTISQHKSKKSVVKNNGSRQLQQASRQSSDIRASSRTISKQKVSGKNITQQKAVKKKTSTQHLSKDHGKKKTIKHKQTSAT